MKSWRCCGGSSTLPLRCPSAGKYRLTNCRKKKHGADTEVREQCKDLNRARRECVRKLQSPQNTPVYCGINLAVNYIFKVH